MMRRTQKAARLRPFIQATENSGVTREITSAHIAGHSHRMTADWLGIGSVICCLAASHPFPTLRHAPSRSQLHRSGSVRHRPSGLEFGSDVQLQSRTPHPAEDLPKRSANRYTCRGLPTLRMRQRRARRAPSSSRTDALRADRCHETEVQVERMPNHGLCG